MQSRRSVLGQHAVHVGVGGDGNRLYTGKYFVTPFISSLETDGATWTNFNSQSYKQGPFQFAFDRNNGIMYASMWFDGVWALKVN